MRIGDRFGVFWSFGCTGSNLRTARGELGRGSFNRGVLGRVDLLEVGNIPLRWFGVVALLILLDDAEVVRPEGP